MPLELQASWSNPEMGCAVTATTSPTTAGTTPVPTLSQETVCAQLQERYGNVPNVSWGTMPTAEQTRWTSMGCDQRMCAVWKKKYNVTATSWGSLPSEYKESFTHPNSGCTDYPQLSSVDKCVLLHKLYGFDVAKQRADWNANSCNPNMCLVMKLKHNVTSTSWGSMPEADKIWFKNASSGCSDFPPDWPDAVSNRCGQIQVASGMLPNVTWGNTSTADQNEWLTKKCNFKVCDFWKKNYNITSTSWGTFPAGDWQKSWHLSCPAGVGPPPPPPPRPPLTGGGSGCSIS